MRDTDLDRLDDEVVKTNRDHPKPIGSTQKFKCRQCGACCVGEGVVWLNEDDIKGIAEYLELSRKEFLRRYTRRYLGVSTPALKDQDDEAISCIFLRPGGCLVHPVKPYQCKTFPHLWTREDAMEICPAMRNALSKKKKRRKKDV